MFPNDMNITRMIWDIQCETSEDRKHRDKAYKALIDNRYTDGEWPKHRGIERVGDLKELKHAGLLKAVPELDIATVNWLMDKIGVKRIGRPKKAA